MVTSFVLLSKGKIYKKKSKCPKKTTTQKIEKTRGAKEEQYLEEHIESAIWDVFACTDFYLVPNHIPAVHITWLDTSSTWNVSRPATKTSTWILIQLCHSVVNFAIACYYIVPVQAPLSSNQVQVQLATVTLRLQWYHSHRPIALPIALVRTLLRQW